MCVVHLRQLVPSLTNLGKLNKSLLHRLQETESNRGNVIEAQPELHITYFGAQTRDHSEKVV